MKERIAALLLVLVMAVSLPPVTAFAADDAQDYKLRVLTFEDADYKGGTDTHFSLRLREWRKPRGGAWRI